MIDVIFHRLFIEPERGASHRVEPLSDTGITGGELDASSETFCHIRGRCRTPRGPAVPELIIETYVSAVTRKVEG